MNALTYLYVILTLSQLVEDYSYSYCIKCKLKYKDVTLLVYVHTSTQLKHHV